MKFEEREKTNPEVLKSGKLACLLSCLFEVCGYMVYFFLT